MHTAIIALLIQIVIIVFFVLCLFIYVKIDNLRRDIDSLKRDIKRLEDRSWERK